MKIELSDAEWMSLIDGEREGGLQRCCANISALRDSLIQCARDSGEVDPFVLAGLKRELGAVIDGHDISRVSALVKVRHQLGLEDDPPHAPDEAQS